MGEQEYKTFEDFVEVGTCGDYQNCGGYVNYNNPRPGGKDEALANFTPDPNWNHGVWWKDDAGVHVEFGRKGYWKDGVWFDGWDSAPQGAMEGEMKNVCEFCAEPIEGHDECGLCGDCAALSKEHGLDSWSDYFDWLNDRGRFSDGGR